MKRYEGIKREHSAVYCPVCKEEIGFADMKCPHCGADARTDPRSYRPRLSSQDIQPGPRERIGGPQQPQDNYSFKAISTIGTVLSLCAVVIAVVAGILAGNASENNIIGILSGILTAIVLLCIVRGWTVQLRNTAKSAYTNERIAFGIEYQIEQMNELITTYNRDKSIEADNAEVFAKLLLKTSKAAEAEKNNLIELTNIVGAMSRKMNKTEPKLTLDEAIEEMDFSDDFDDEVTEEKAEEVSAEESKAEETAVAEETEESAETEEAETETVEEPEENTEEESEEEPKEEPEETEEEYYTIECPNCGGDIKYTDEQLDNGVTDLVCENCGASIELEVSEIEEDEEEAPDAQSDYERAFGKDEEIKSSSLGSRLDAFLDEDED